MYIDGCFAAVVSFLTLLCVQLQRAMSVTHCAQTQAAGAQDLTSVCPVGTTVEKAHVWPAVIFTLGRLIHAYFIILSGALDVFHLFVYCIYFCHQSSKGICRASWRMCCLPSRV